MGRFEDYPGLVGTGVQLLENRLPATAREFESHTLRHFGVRMGVLTLFFAYTASSDDRTLSMILALSRLLSLSTCA